MRRNNKRILTMMVMLTVSMATVTGCNRESNDVGNANEIEESADKEVNDTQNVNISSTTEADEDKDATDKDVTSTVTEAADTEESDVTDKEDTEASTKDMVEISIYTMNDETLETEDAIALVPANEELTAEVIVNAVVSVFSDNNYDVGVQSVSQENDTVIVNLLSNSAPVTGVGASAEATTLDCISYSLIDNLPSCNKVIFRIEGEAYETGHIKYGIDEPYCIR
ncbi:MAG TPA: hypothetical protein VHP81_01360 [Lachnospiraceae bacterium]|nr:hypothetical protein [Lachnospiraceae bacterium]